MIILSRINLGEADFSKGVEAKNFEIKKGIFAAPFIWFEVLFPNFVRNRVLNGTNLLVNITNDGWWGRSLGPYHHAAMSRMRSIENGVSMARCANSGITMFIDQFGRILSTTTLYERTVLTQSLKIKTIPTLYTKYGNWFVWFSFLAIPLYLPFLSI